MARQNKAAKAAAEAQAKVTKEQEADIKKLASLYKDLYDVQVKMAKLSPEADGNALSELEKQEGAIRDNIQAIEKLNAAYRESDAVQQAMADGLDRVSLALAQQADKAAKAAREQEAAAKKAERASDAMKTYTSFGEKIVDRMVDLGVDVLFESLRSGWDMAKSHAEEYYDLLNQIRIVSGMSEEEADALGDKYIDMAKDMKVGSSDIAKAATEYRRQGLGESKVEDRLVWTTKYAKIAALEFDTAAELITAATNSMEISAQRAADVFTYLGDASASGPEEIGLAMQKASASAKQFGLSFEWLGAYIATISEQTRQAPEVIGTSLNSIMSRLHSIKQLGYNEEDSTRINDIAKALSVVDVELMNQDGSWRSMSVIFDEIAAKWDTLTDKQQSYISTTMAGTRQQNYFLTLMNDMAKGAEGGSRAYELYEGAISSAGTVSEKFAVWQESVAAAQGKANAQWEEFFNLFDGGKLLKGFHEVSGGLAQFLTDTTEATNGWSLGLTGAAVAAGAATMALPALIKGITAVGGAIKLAFTGHPVVAGITIAIAAIAGLVTAIGSLNDAMEETINYEEEISHYQNKVANVQPMIDEYVKLTNTINKTDTELDRMNELYTKIHNSSYDMGAALDEANISIGNQQGAVEVMTGKMNDWNEAIRTNIALQAKQTMSSVDSAKAAYGIKTDYNNVSEAVGRLQFLDSDQQKFMNELGETISLSMRDLSASEWAKNVEQIFANQGAGDNASAVYHLDKLLREYVGDPNAWGFWSAQDYKDLYYEMSSIFTQQEASMQKIQDWALENTSLMMDRLGGTDAFEELTTAQVRAVEDYVQGSLENALLESESEQDLLDRIEDVYRSAVDRMQEVVSDPQIESTAIRDMLIGLFGEEVPEDFINKVLDWELSSDAVKKAIDNVASFFKGDANLIDQFWKRVLGGGRPGLVFEEWSDGLGGIRTELMALTDLDEGNFIDLEEMLIGEGKGPEDILKVYQTLWTGFSKGLVEVEAFTSAMANPKAFSEFISDLNKVDEAVDDQADRLEKNRAAWGNYIDDLNDPTKMAGVYDDVQKQIKRVSELDSALRIWSNEGGIYGRTERSKAKQFIEDELGAVAANDYAIAARLVRNEADTVRVGLLEIADAAKLGNAAALEFMDSMKRSYLSESGAIDNYKVFLTELKNMPRPDNVPFNVANFDAAMQNGDMNFNQMASTMNVLIALLDEGYISWQNLIDAIADGAFTLDEAKALIDLGDMESMMSKLKEGAKASSDENKLSLLDMFVDPETDLDLMADTLAKLEKDTEGFGEDFKENFGFSDELWEDIADGGELAEKSVKELNRAIRNLNMKRSAKYFDDTVEAILDLEEGTTDATKAFAEFWEEADALKEANDEYAAGVEKLNQGLELTAEDVQGIADYLNIRPETVIANWEIFGNTLQSITSEGEAALRALQEAAFVHIVGTSSVDFSVVESGLLNVQSLGKDALDVLLTLGAFKMETISMPQSFVTFNKDGTKNYHSANSTATVLVPTSDSLFKTPGGSSSGKKTSGGGGGGGGSKNQKADATQDESRLVENMDWEIEQIERKMKRLDAIMSGYETEGYLTGVINALQQENGLIEEQNGLYEKNIGILDGKIAELRGKLSQHSVGTAEYDEVLSELEILQDAYEEYSLALMENRNALLENTEAIEEQYETIREMEIDLRDTIAGAIEDRQEREEESLDARIEMEETLMDVITERYEKERDEILETTEARIDALNEEMDALDRALDARKDEAEDEDRLLELANLQAQYAKILADPTRMKEAQELQKKIAELQKEIAWDIAEEEVEAQKEALEQQIGSLEDYMDEVEDHYDKLLESPKNFMDEVNEIMGRGQDGIVEWLKANSEEYNTASQAAQEQMVQEWKDTLGTLYQLSDTPWGEVEQIISQGDEAIIDYLKQNSQDYREASAIEQEAMVDEWRKQLEDLRKAYEPKVPEVTVPEQINTIATATDAAPSSSSGGGGSGSSSAKKWYVVAADGTKLTSGYAKKADAESKKSSETTTWQHAYAGLQYSDPAQAAKNAAEYAKWKNSSIKQYLSGGLVTATGPAWLDGTPDKPERVLNPIQTDLFETLVKSLEAIRMRAPSPTFGGPEMSKQSGTNNFGDININIEKLETDEDYEEIAEKVMEVIEERMTRGSAVGGIRIM